ncbi:MAG: hypothetical protein Q9174_003179 [Haloplaca sp. 1 TL-2023]
MSHPGKVAGLFVGVAIIILLLIAAVFFFLRRRKLNAQAGNYASTAGGTPQRQVSKLSTVGLLGGTRGSKKRKSVPAIQTSGSGWGLGDANEKSPTDTPVEYHRSSYPRVVDQRLEPTRLWNPIHGNGSHVSVQSLQDNQDYSRRMLKASDTHLVVTNPDQRPPSRD